MKPSRHVARACVRRTTPRPETGPGRAGTSKFLTTRQTRAGLAAPIGTNNPQGTTNPQGSAHRGRDQQFEKAASLGFGAFEGATSRSRTGVNSDVPHGLFVAVRK